jgi:CHAD domain-containing protein
MVHTVSQSPLLRPFRKRLDAFARELSGVEQGSVEALHRARVASRRLRELLPLLEMDRDTSRKLNRRLRRVTKQLGIVRELDVLTLLIEEFRRNGRYPPTALKNVGEAVGGVRDTARERLTAKLPPAKLERLADRLERAAERFESDDATARRAGAAGPTRAWLSALETRLARRAARVRSAIEVAGALYVPERLHDVRIALKKLRYAAELAAEVRHRRMTADVAALKRAQDTLGRGHDLEVLVAWGRRVQASLSPPDLTTWKELGSLVHAAEDDSRRSHAQYMRDRPGLIVIADRTGATMPHAAVAGRRAAS